ncbi:hypothetical protein M2408_000236 [Sphingobacterium sp. BIGb0165]|nr:hypothetical protein [Sphingobacterium sp. BIGb0165]
MKIQNSIYALTKIIVKYISTLRPIKIIILAEDLSLVHVSIDSWGYVSGFICYRAILKTLH